VKKTFLSLGIGIILLLTPSLAAAFGGESDVTPLSNKDVLLMVQNHQSEEAIINIIKTSPCTFDTFPPVLKDMKRRGVPDAILQAMIDAPYGPSQQTTAAKNDNGDQPIYHYADQLRQMGYIAPTTSGQARFPKQNVRARNNRTTRTRL
jgi:hypothetical protein